MQAMFEQKIAHWKSESGKIDLAIYRRTMDQVLKVTKEELTARSIGAEGATPKLEILKEQVMQAKDDTEIKAVMAKYVEFAQWIDMSEKGTRAVMNILGAGAGARFIGKGLGAVGNNIGKQLWQIETHKVLV